jgi:hypothetical protein
VSNPKTAWRVVSSLQHSLAEGAHGIDCVPKLIVRVIAENLWCEFYCEPMQSEVRHESFERYVTDNLPTGLGTTIRFLKNLCRDDTEAIEAIDRATKREPGNELGVNQHTRDELGTFDIIQDSKAPTGTSRDAAIRRLRKDRPDLLEKVIAGQLSAHAAAIEAGHRKKPSQAEVCVKAFRKVENRLEVLRLIVNELEPHEAAVLRDWSTERLH